MLRATEESGSAVEDARTRRALLNILEDLQKEHRLAKKARRQWVETVDALSDPLMVHDVEFRIVRCNQAYARRAGMEIKEILGRHAWECFPRGSGPSPACARAVDQRLPTSEEELIIDGGEVFHLRCFAAERGASPTWLSVFEDITERKRAEQALDLRERRFRALIENASDLLVMLDRGGKIAYISPSIARLGGYLPDEVIGRNYLEFAHPEDVPKARERLLQVIAGPDQADASEVRFRHKDGRWIILESIARNALGDPAIDAIVINARDITGRKTAEDSMRRLNRIYAVLSGINNLIVRKSSRKELFDAACGIAVKEGKFISAAIAEYDPHAEMLVAVAQQGAFDGFVGNGLSTRADSPHGESTAVRSVRERKPVWDDDLMANPNLGPNRARNIAAGARAIISLPLYLDEHVEGVLVLFAAEKNFFDEKEVRLLSELAGDISHALDYLAKSRRVEKSKATLRRSLEATIEAIAAALEMRDPYTAGHQRRVADLTAAIAREMGLPQDKVEGIHFGALIHDLGKLQVPAEILAKPTRLSKVEFELIKAHPQAGYDIIKGIDFPWPVAAMVHQHHERLDGSGYPQGLKGDAIALEARILAVADVVEAMASHRPYRPGLGMEAALKEIIDKRGTFFDPDAVDACVRLFREGRFSL